MKKALCMFILIITLCSCSNSTASNATAEPTSEPTQTSTPPYTNTQTPDANMPDDLTYNQKRILEKCLFTLNPGECEYTITDYEDSETLGPIISLDVETEKRMLSITIYEKIEECLILGKENKHIYYVQDNAYKETYDIYDYNTDKLIQKASGKDATDIAKEESDKLDKEFEQNLDDLKKKYGLDY